MVRSSNDFGLIHNGTTKVINAHRVSLIRGALKNKKKKGKHGSSVNEERCSSLRLEEENGNFYPGFFLWRGKKTILFGDE